MALIIALLVSGIFAYIKESQAAAINKEFDSHAAGEARVIRMCNEIMVPAEDLVLGDILVLRMGDVVPADCRIINASEGFMVDNSPITGESEPIPLDPNASHEKQLFSRNMAFFSAWVVRGEATAVVTRTGIHTVMGQMADLTAANPKNPTLITEEISTLVHYLTSIGIGMGLFCFILAFILGK